MREVAATTSGEAPNCGLMKFTEALDDEGDDGSASLGVMGSRSVAAGGRVNVTCAFGGAPTGSMAEVAVLSEGAGSALRLDGIDIEAISFG
jgi:hypothetical protein